jgi:hypothetical protein
MYFAEISQALNLDPKQEETVTLQKLLENQSIDVL